MFSPLQGPNFTGGQSAECEVGPSHQD